MHDMWKKYYEVVSINTSKTRRTAYGWAIAYNAYCEENAGKLAYEVVYRTEENAERGAERLYKRTHGWLEEAIGLGTE